MEEIGRVALGSHYHGLKQGNDGCDDRSDRHFCGELTQEVLDSANTSPSPNLGRRPKLTPHGFLAPEDPGIP